MKLIKSFSLSDDIVKIIDELPKNERSKTIEQILRQELLNENNKIETAINQILDMLKGNKLNVHVQEENVLENNMEDKIINSLNSILQMRDDYTT